MYYGLNDPRNTSFRVKIPETKEQELGCLIAIKRAILTAEQSILHIETDCKHIVEILTTKLPKLENQGFMLSEHTKQIRATVAELRGRHHKTTLLYLPRKEKEQEIIMEINILLQEASNLNDEIEEDLETNPNLLLTGAKLSSLNQATAYKILRALKMKDYSKRRQTQENLKVALQAPQLITLKEQNIWVAIRHPDLHRNARAFLWMTIHDAYMVGSNWLRPGFAPEYQERSECQHCHEIETMEHILKKCQSPGQKQVWRLAKRLWYRKTGKNMVTTFGTILATPAITLHKSVRKSEVGKNRMLRILMIESVHLIWKLRCERVIQKENAAFTRNEIKNKWTHVLNDRLDLDRKLTHQKFGKKALPIKLVKATWQGTLQNEETLPENWITDDGVLVGIDLQDDDGRGQNRPR